LLGHEDSSVSNHLTLDVELSGVLWSLNFLLLLSVNLGSSLSDGFLYLNLGASLLDWSFTSDDAVLINSSNDSF